MEHKLLVCRRTLDLKRSGMFSFIGLTLHGVATSTTLFSEVLVLQTV